MMNSRRQGWPTVSTTCTSEQQYLKDARTIKNNNERRYSSFPPPTQCKKIFRKKEKTRAINETGRRRRSNLQPIDQPIAGVRSSFPYEDCMRHATDRDRVQETGTERCGGGDADADADADPDAHCLVDEVTDAEADRRWLRRCCFCWCSWRRPSRARSMLASAAIARDRALAAATAGDVSGSGAPPSPGDSCGGERADERPAEGGDAFARGRGGRERRLWHARGAAVYIRELSSG
uniref:Uncharacterized protein n=1 Tax=Zea mays TaxID=4577 RepID=A0A804LS23_MAIZE